MNIIMYLRSGRDFILILHQKSQRGSNGGERSLDFFDWRSVKRASNILKKNYRGTRASEQKNSQYHGS